jgi:hypothetical protein
MTNEKELVKLLDCNCDSCEFSGIKYFPHECRDLRVEKIKQFISEQIKKAVDEYDHEIKGDTIVGLADTFSHRIGVKTTFNIKRTEALKKYTGE